MSRSPYFTRIIKSLPKEVTPGSITSWFSSNATFEKPEVLQALADECNQALKDLLDAGCCDIKIPSKMTVPLIEPIAGGEIQLGADCKPISYVGFSPGQASAVRQEIKSRSKLHIAVNLPMIVDTDDPKILEKFHYYKMTIYARQVVETWQQFQLTRVSNRDQFHQWSGGVPRQQYMLAIFLLVLIVSVVGFDQTYGASFVLAAIPAFAPLLLTDGLIKDIFPGPLLAIVGKWKKLQYHFHGWKKTMGRSNYANIPPNLGLNFQAFPLEGVAALGAMSLARSKLVPYLSPSSENDSVLKTVGKKALALLKAVKDKGRLQPRDSGAGLDEQAAQAMQFIEAFLRQTKWLGDSGIPNADQLLAIRGVFADFKVGVQGLKSILEHEAKSAITPLIRTCSERILWYVMYTNLRGQAIGEEAQNFIEDFFKLLDKIEELSGLEQTTVKVRTDQLQLLANTLRHQFFKDGKIALSKAITSLNSDDETISDGDLQDALVLRFFLEAIGYPPGGLDLRQEMTANHGGSKSGGPEQRELAGAFRLARVLSYCSDQGSVESLEELRECLNRFNVFRNTYESKYFQKQFSPLCQQFDDDFLPKKHSIRNSPEFLNWLTELRRVLKKHESQILLSEAPNIDSGLFKDVRAMLDNLEANLTIADAGFFGREKAISQAIRSLPESVQQGGHLLWFLQKVCLYSHEDIHRLLHSIPDSNMKTFLVSDMARILKSWEAQGKSTHDVERDLKQMLQGNIPDEMSGEIETSMLACHLRPGQPFAPWVHEIIGFVIKEIRATSSLGGQGGSKQRSEGESQDALWSSENIIKKMIEHFILLDLVGGDDMVGPMLPEGPGLIEIVKERCGPPFEDFYNKQSEWRRCVISLIIVFLHAFLIFKCLTEYKTALCLFVVIGYGVDFAMQRFLAELSWPMGVRLILAQSKFKKLLDNSFRKLKKKALDSGMTETFEKIYGRYIVLAFGVLLGFWFLQRHPVIGVTMICMSGSMHQFWRRVLAMPQEEVALVLERLEVEHRTAYGLLESIKKRSEMVESSPVDYNPMKFLRHRTDAAVKNMARHLRVSSESIRSFLREGARLESKDAGTSPGSEVWAKFEPWWQKMMGIRFCFKQLVTYGRVPEGYEKSADGKQVRILGETTWRDLEGKTPDEFIYDDLTKRLLDIHAGFVVTEREYAEINKRFPGMIGFPIGIENTTRGKYRVSASAILDKMFARLSKLLKRKSEERSIMLNSKHKTNEALIGIGMRGVRPVSSRQLSRRKSQQTESTGQTAGLESAGLLLTLMFGGKRCDRRQTEGKMSDGESEKALAKDLGLESSPGSEI